jgi:hypothetical protein
MKNFLKKHGKSIVEFIIAVVIGFISFFVKKYAAGLAVYA